MDISTTQSEPNVVTTEDETGQISEESGDVESGIEQSENLAEGAYDPSKYIQSVGQSELSIGLPEKAEICVIQGDRFERGTDDLTAVGEDLANLQFFSDQESGDTAINWFEYEESAEVTGWLDDQPDIVEYQPEQGPAGARVSVVAGKAESQNPPPESAGTKNFAQNLGIVNAGNIDQPAVLTQLEQQRFEDSERIRKAKAHVGVESAVCTRTGNAAGMKTSTLR